MSQWHRFDYDDPHTYPLEPGLYAVMIEGDSERDGPHVFYDFDDYQTFATLRADEDLLQFKCTHDEDEETIFAWYGPLAIPPCDVNAG